MATYIHGNTVRKEELARPVVKNTPKKTSGTQADRNRSRALHIGRGYVIFLALSATVALAACVHYLQIRSEVSMRSAHVTTLQTQVSTLQEENTARQDAIVNSVNLEDVRKTAMEKLNMVYASDEQIVKYKDPLGNHITQYSMIPESGVLVNAANISQ